MTMKTHWLAILVLACILVVTTCFAATPAPNRDSAARPNVIVFLADDAGWGDYGIHGNGDVRTPNIDSIATRGVRFENFYVCPVCSPTRAEFLTGRYHLRGGVRGVSEGDERLDVDERTIADAFHQAGYATGAFGKWHNGSQWPYHPMARGFDHFYGFTSGHWGEYIDPPLEDDGRRTRGEGYIDDCCVDRAIEFIEQHRDRPFFCYIPFVTPHSPWSAPQAKWEKYRQLVPSQHATEAALEIQAETRCVYAMIENQDDLVGRVLDRLKSLEIDENTIVIYFSDNGPNTWRWNGQMKGKKGGLDEGSLRAPLLVHWPDRIEGGRRLDSIAGAIDLLPTILALAGVPHVTDRPIDGINLSPLLLGESVEIAPRSLVTHYQGRYSLRNASHRLDPQGRLFDIASDRSQAIDCNADQPLLAMQMLDTVGRWRQTFERELEADGSAARPFPIGFPQFPWTPLPARDGIPHGAIARSSSAPNCSYFVNWTNTDDAITWDVDVHQAGRYEVVLEYVCPLEDEGSEIELRLGDRMIAGRVSPGWYPDVYRNQDTLPRPPAESTMKPFRELNLGMIELTRGPGTLTLKATHIPGRSVMELLAIHLTLQPPPD
jgi:arylsulfatase A-like enzyme